MPWQGYKLIGFAPDLPVTTPGVFTDMQYVVPTDRGYGPGPVYALASSAALNNDSLNAALLSKTDNTQELIIGTVTKLYGFDLATTLTDRSAAAYNATATNTWSITQFGNIALAANLGDQLQQRTIGAGANFASVGAAPVPKASIVVTCGPVTAPFVMVFDYIDGVNTDRDGWKCSAISDYTGWTAGTNSCATGRLLDNSPGPVTAAIPYRDGVIAWKRNAMYVGRYDGPPAIWAWQRISSDVGCIGKNACVVADDVVYFTDESGIWMFDGSNPRRVPGYTQKFWGDKYVLGVTDADRNLTRVVWDKPKHLLWFLAPSSGSRTTIPGVTYNTVSQLWGLLRGQSFANAGGTIVAADMLSARWVFAPSSLKVVSLSWGASGGEPRASTINGWGFCDRINTTNIGGIRPHWANSPQISVSNWCSGNVYQLGSLRDMQPGAAIFPVATATFAGAFRQPGKIDVKGSGDAITFDMAQIAGIDWEMDGLSLDVARVGRS